MQQQLDVAGMSILWLFTEIYDTDSLVSCRFKGAWVSVWEKETCSDIFGDMDVIADDLPSLADKIVASATA